MTASDQANIEHIPVPVADVKTEVVGGELLLYHPRDARAIYLSPSAAVIWSLCDGHRRIGDIIALIGQSYPDSTDSVTADVFATIAQLRESGVLTGETG
jgi:hypothetical protein